MTAREFADLASGLASLAIVALATVVVVVVVLRYRADRPRTKVGAPPVDRDDDP